jgi:hypothetical protein
MLHLKLALAALSSGNQEEPKVDFNIKACKNS